MGCLHRIYPWNSLVKETHIDIHIIQEKNIRGNDAMTNPGNDKMLKIN